VHTDDAREQGFERALRQSLAAPAAVPPGDCVDAETLAAWSDGALAPLQSASVELHLASCPSCQALLAAFVRTTPAQPASLPFWRRWQLQWLVPLATATAALTIWLVIPGRTPGQLQPVREDRPVAQLSAPSSPPVPPDSPEQASRYAAPSSLSTPPPGLPRPTAPAGTSPQQERAAVADALTKSLERAQREKEAGGRVAAVAGAATPPNVELRARVEAASRARAALEERKVADAAAAAPAAAPTAAPPPAAKAATPDARPAPAPPGAPPPDPQAPSRAATPSRQEQAAGLAQARAFKVSTIDVTSPTSTTRWRIAIGRAVDYFGTSAPSGRPTDIPAAAAIVAGSSPQDDVCWMVGGGGAVYLTTDGTQFTRVAFPEAVDLVDVRATDAKTAMVTAASGRTYRTTDSGKSWQQQ
jgi:Putative zinc-finger